MILEADMATTHFGSHYEGGSCAHGSTSALFPKLCHLTLGIDRSSYRIYTVGKPSISGFTPVGILPYKAMRSIFKGVWYIARAAALILRPCCVTTCLISQERL